ncbi:hypothetical protein MXB_3030 [Myxobolus squamalis]|nr:hypothetical protein MXB_3030 [Myxobolus squamalis]
MDELEIGVAYIQQNALQESNKWQYFWYYFKRRWLKPFALQIWNIYDISECNIRERINNYLERYNRSLNLI